MSASKTWSGVRVHTVGHSTRTFDELLTILRSFDVGVLADIRTIPRSRHNPQFNRDALSAALPAQGIDYVHIPRLGGLRKPRPDSPNSGWRNASFRGFADYMSTDEFEAGLDELRVLTEKGHVSIMCAEAVPWRCHRSLVADVLIARGASVEHATAPMRAAHHRVTSFAKIAGSRVTYPAVE